MITTIVAFAHEEAPVKVILDVIHGFENHGDVVEEIHRAIEKWGKVKDWGDVAVHFQDIFRLTEGITQITVRTEDDIVYVQYKLQEGK